MYAGQYHVRALARQGQPVLQQHLHLAETGLDQRVGERRDAAFPGAHFRRVGSVAVFVQEVFAQELCQSSFEMGAGGQRRRGLTEQQEMPPGSTK